jgi:hypothetical protein
MSVFQNGTKIMELFFAWLFVTLVVLYIADFSDIGNLQFAITFVAFLLYLLYLGGYIKVEMIRQYIELPNKLKDMFGLELDLYIKSMNGMKDVMGNDPSESVIDEKSLNLQGEAMSNVQQEYFLADKVFRDLRIANSNLYIEKVFSA